MKKILKLNLNYLFTFLTTLSLLVLIAIYIKGVVRTFFGDVFVIILIYFFIKSFLYIKIKLITLYIFLFAVIIEISQYFHIIDLLKIKNKIIRIALGNTFDIADIFAYFIGFVAVSLIDYYLNKIYKKIV